MNIYDVLFVICASVSVSCALVVVTRRSPVYAALFLLPMFLALAVLYLLLAAPFLAAMQILVYAGAIIVVFLFVIMLINLRPEDELDEGPRLRWLPALAVGGALLYLLGLSIVRGLGGTAFVESGELPRALAEFGSTRGVGLAMFDAYVVPFELASVLIVAAILGAILLSKEKL